MEGIMKSKKHHPSCATQNADESENTCDCQYPLVTTGSIAARKNREQMQKKKIVNNPPQTEMSKPTTEYPIIDESAPTPTPTQSDKRLDDLLEAAAQKLLTPILRLLQNDPHQWSTRPCQTCQAITDIVGKPFGCVYMRETGNRTFKL